MLFKVLADKPVRETNGNIDAVPEFLGVDDTALKYVFLMRDYDSPYNRLPYDMRKDLILVSLGMTDSKKSRDFFTANAADIDRSGEAFNKMQFSVEHETIISMKQQLSNWNKIMAQEKQNDREMAIIQKVFEKLPAYMQRVKELEEIVGYRDKSDQDMNMLEKTALEVYMQNKKKKNGSTGK